MAWVTMQMFGGVAMLPESVMPRPQWVIGQRGPRFRR